MDPLITTATRPLAAGDPLGALKRVALRDDPPALALRGIAMAQLGWHSKNFRVRKWCQALVICLLGREADTNIK
jgi:hypothetical protein